MYQHMSSKRLKESAKARLFRVRGITIGATASYLGILALVQIITTLLIPDVPEYFLLFQVICGLFISVISGMLSAGYQCLFLKFYCGQRIQVSDLFYGFTKNTGTFFLLSLILAFLETVIQMPSDYFSSMLTDDLLLTNIPYQSVCYLGVTSSIAIVLIMYIKLIYSQVYYLALDFPAEKTISLLRMSRKFMKGHKGRLFYIYASFIPLILLSILTLGIGFLWLLPYIQAVLTEFYLDIATHKS